MRRSLCFVRRKIARPPSLGALLALAAVASACGVPSQESVTSEEGAIGEASCATTPATSTQVGTLDYTSPGTYNPRGCYRAVMADLINADSIDYVAVSWADDVALDQATCEIATVTAYVYVESGAGWVKRDIDGGVGRWVKKPSAILSYECKMPKVHFPGPFVKGRNYRLVATARLGASGPTRMVSIKSSSLDLEPECAQDPFVKQNISFQGTNVNWFSPTFPVYGTLSCPKAYVVGYEDPYQQGSPPQLLDWPNWKNIYTTYAGPEPTTQESCEKSAVIMDVYTDRGNLDRVNLGTFEPINSAFIIRPFPYFVGSAIGHGTQYWDPVLKRARCQAAFASVALPVHDASKKWQYKVIASARYADNSIAPVMVQPDCGEIGGEACRAGIPCRSGYLGANLHCQASPPPTTVPPPPLPQPTIPNPPAAPTASCAFTVNYSLSNCLNNDGTDASLKFDAWGCGSTVEEAAKLAAISAVTSAGRQGLNVCDQAGPNCCTYTEQIYPGCVCGNP